MIREKEEHVPCFYEKSAHEYDVGAASSLVGVGDVGRERAGAAEEIRRELRQRQTNPRQRKIELLRKLNRQQELAEIRAGTTTSTDDNSTGSARHGSGAKNRKRGAVDTSAAPAAKQMRKGGRSYLPPSSGASEHIVVVSSRDVLNGRGSGSQNFAGNVTFRELASRMKELYSTACKFDKIKVSKAVVSVVRESGGRFLKERGDGTYVDIGDERAWAKASQALREGQPEVRTQLKADAGGPARVKEYEWIISEQAFDGYAHWVLEGIHNEQEQCKPMELPPSPEFSAPDNNEASSNTPCVLIPESHPVIPVENGHQDKATLHKLNQLERQVNILLAQSSAQMAGIVWLKRQVKEQAGEIARLRKRECVERGAHNAFVERETTWF